MPILRAEHSDQTERLSSEIEAWLGGRTAERATGRQRPAWVWLNALAHGSFEQIVALANQRRVFGRDRAWCEARRLLAREILAVAGDELEQLQREVLVPIELRLIDGTDSSIEPSQLAGRVLIAIDNSRFARHSGEAGDE